MVASKNPFAKQILHGFLPVTENRVNSNNGNEEMCIAYYSVLTELFGGNIIKWIY